MNCGFCGMEIKRIASWANQCIHCGVTKSDMGEIIAVKKEWNRFQIKLPEDKRMIVWKQVPKGCLVILTDWTTELR